MGIINVTPDSFSDGGDAFQPTAAIDRGMRLVEAGADIVDVGGESTRPGATPVTLDEELRRVVPVIAALAAAGAVVSVDTRHARVMAEAIAAGASIVNDISALAGDHESLDTVARSPVSAVLMHMQGDPTTMQDEPQYQDAARDIASWLADRVACCEAAGLPRRRLAVDPGIGFGKTVEHNLDVLARLRLFQDLGCVIVVGASRKSFIGRLDRIEAPKQRLGGSIAAGLAAVARGAHILRVHDVAETRQALAVWQAIDGAGGCTGASPVA